MELCTPHRPEHFKTRATHAGPRQYASKLTTLLVDAGARPLWTPCVDITALEDTQDVSALDGALRNLQDFTHIAFTSKNGVHACVDHLHRVYGDGAPEAVARSAVRLCALGADAQARTSHS